jgi:hypothetical protein
MLAHQVSKVTTLLPYRQLHMLLTQLDELQLLVIELGAKAQHLLAVGAPGLAVQSNVIQPACGACMFA